MPFYSRMNFCQWVGPAHSLADPSLPYGSGINYFCNTVEAMAELWEAVLRLADEIQHENLPVEAILIRLDEILEMLGMTEALENVTSDH